MTTPELPHNRYSEQVDSIKAAELLALDEKSLAWRRALATIAEQTHTAALRARGNLSPLAVRLMNPVPGDIVFEHLSFYMDDPERHMKGFGILDKIAMEPFYSDEQWAAIVSEYNGAAMPTPNRTSETAYYIHYGPAEDDVCRWTNASFLVVPLSPSFVSEALFIATDI